MGLGCNPLISGLVQPTVLQNFRQTSSVNLFALCELQQNTQFTFALVLSTPDITHIEVVLSATLSLATGLIQVKEEGWTGFS